ncbi:hypothetical protein GY45DRAFT_1325369 [Cubamyces sp. BRFM 1775]|nr:hypothetical protein GY45DRAFT_1325369 [Cubamyces sp. BRFM 1775]
MGRLYHHGALEYLQRLRQMKGVDDGGLRAVWTGYRQDASLLAKFKWWSNHAWSDPVAWNLIWFDLYLPAHSKVLDAAAATISRRDWDILITHFANYVQRVDGVPCTFDPDHFVYACYAIAPFAICARMMCPPVVYLPINIAQRVVIYTAWAVYCIRRYQHYRYTAMIKDKGKVAGLFRKAIPQLEKRVDEVIGQGHSGW